MSVVNTNTIEINAPILMISGCRDNQTIADAYIEKENQGAMTASLLFTLKKLEYSTTCFELLKEMRNYLRYNNYTQIPQLSSSKKINNVSIFCCKDEIYKFVS